MRQSMIDPSMSVNEVIRRYPQTIAVFNRFGVDTCCGGAASVADAARDTNVKFEELMDALNQLTLPGVEARAS